MLEIQFDKGCTMNFTKSNNEKIVKLFSLLSLFVEPWWNDYDDCTASFNRPELTLDKKRSFTSRLSSANVTKSAENCGFGYIC